MTHYENEHDEILGIISFAVIHIHSYKVCCIWISDFSLYESKNFPKLLYFLDRGIVKLDDVNR